MALRLTRLLRQILPICLCVAPMGAAWAANLSIERIFGDPALAGPTPKGVKVSPDGKRVGFLRGSRTDQNQLNLWTYDTATGTLAERVDSKSLLPAETLSDAEKARRERARTADLHGIVDYDWAPDGHRVMFSLGGALYLYDLNLPAQSALQQITSGKTPVLDPQVSPKGRYVSYIQDQDLWVIDLTTLAARQLTTGGGGNVHNGEAEFIAQEELDQRTGYWWAPDDSAIAFKHFDESHVPVARRFEIYADRTEVVEQRYPAAGDPNVLVGLGVVSLADGKTHWVDLGHNPDIYLARVDWLPDAHRLAYQRLFRDQKSLDLVLADPYSGQQTTLLTETSKTWVEVTDDLHFLKQQEAFVWSSERTGMRHLYLVDLSGKVLHPITQGNWTLDGVLAVDESQGLVYFDSNKDAVPERQIYSARLDGSQASAPHRVSQQAGWHAAKFAKDADQVTLYVDTWSDWNTPPQVSVCDANGKRLAWIEENRLDDTHPYWPYHQQHGTPKVGTLTAEDGQLLYYSVLTPPNFKPDQRYPVFVTVYGGPTAQTVQRDWVNPIDEYMAQQGYVVFHLDNRGSSRRGRAFSDVIYGQLGEVEVHDQLAGIAWLKQQPWVDAKRVGVFGWSYGGYMTLMLLAKGSDHIAAGAAVAPVTDWRLYDTAYTERYLSRPQDNLGGFERSAVFAALDGMKSPLLLAHGMADDNVLFVNTTRLISELQTRGVQFSLMTYPGAKHGLSTPAMKRHVYTAIKQFMDEKLSKPRN